MRKEAKKLTVDKEIALEDKPVTCHKCGSPTIWVAKRRSQVIFDLKFTRRGIKRWTIRYKYNAYRCGW